jgi:hypothetical protein
MSRGLGRIERRILRTMHAPPEQAFTADPPKGRHARCLPGRGFRTVRLQ